MHLEKCVMQVNFFVELQKNEHKLSYQNVRKKSWNTKFILPVSGDNGGCAKPEGSEVEFEYTGEECPTDEGVIANSVEVCWLFGIGGFTKLDKFKEAVRVL